MPASLPPRRIPPTDLPGRVRSHFIEDLGRATVPTFDSRVWGLWTGWRLQDRGRAFMLGLAVGGSGNWVGWSEEKLMVG